MCNLSASTLLKAIPKLIMLKEGGVARPIVGRFEFWKRKKG